MLKKIVLLACALSVLSVKAQVDIQKIKKDTAYIWAEGVGTTFEEADKDALRKLSSQIWTFIRADVIDGDEIQSVFISSFTSNTIPNARMLELAPEPECRIFRYVHEDDVKKMQDDKRLRIVDLVKAGQNAESRLQIDDALRNYYWALMLSKSHTEPVYVELGGKNVECKAELPAKIKSVLGGINAELVECKEQNGIHAARMHFTYLDHDVASLQLRYDNGQAFIGPLAVRDGVGEFDLVKLPNNNKLVLRYEYRFAEEAEHLNEELEAVIEGIKAYSIDSRVEIPVKVNAKKGKMTAVKSRETANTGQPMSDYKEVLPENIKIRERIKEDEVEDSRVYMQAVSLVENAIIKSSPDIARSCFTDDGYKMFNTLLTKTGRVTISGEQDYSFVKAGDQVLGRSCNIKIKFSNGRTYMEKLVFRFNPISHKIQSIALRLTKKAEDDIFNAKSPWGEISRYTILQFMEDYQTAFALKRHDYLTSIFSDSALIITGAVLKPTIGKFNDGREIDFSGNKNVRYVKHTKQEYLKKLKRHFDTREYIHLTFENNITGVVNTNGVLRDDAAFAIQIRQFYDSPKYSDRGYLTLFLNMQGKYPIIEVRLWQPEQDVISYEDFKKVFYVK